MQAPKASIAEKACKDKFLIQSTVVATGTTEKDITPNMVIIYGFTFEFDLLFWLYLLSLPFSLFPFLFGSSTKMMASILKRSSWKWPSSVHLSLQYYHQLMGCSSRNLFLELQCWEIQYSVKLRIPLHHTWLEISSSLTMLELPN